jgi:hypothetical protein
MLKQGVFNVLLGDFRLHSAKLIYRRDTHPYWLSLFAAQFSGSRAMALEVSKHEL